MGRDSVPERKNRTQTYLILVSRISAGKDLFCDR
jgi:hypothetical protein